MFRQFENLWFFFSRNCIEKGTEIRSGGIYCKIQQLKGHKTPQGVNS